MAIKVGIIGYGLSAKTFHIPLLLALKDAYQITHVLQRRGNDAETELSAQGVNITICRSIEELVASHIDLVIISTPINTHVEFATKALKAGKNVICEKPFTLTETEAREIFELASRQGLSCTVYHNRRYDGDYLTMKKLIASDRVGTISKFESRFDRNRPKIAEGWKEDPSFSPGLLYDLGAHLVDQALQLFGKPESISATILNERGGTVDDNFTIQLHYSQQPSLEVIVAAGSLVPEGSKPRFFLQGSKGSYTKFHLDVQEDQLRKFGVKTTDSIFGVESEDCWGILKSSSDSQPITTERGDWRGFYRDVAQALQSSDLSQLPVSSDQALLVTKILELSKRASATNEKVEI